jgi:adenosine kinase
MARMSGDEIKLLIEGAAYLFLNEYELALAMQKTGWSDREILERVKYRVVTLGSKGAKVESAAGEFVQVSCPKENSKMDPTGVGDSFRSGFIAGLAWGVSHERCAQLGALIATYVIETLGTQEYRFTKAQFVERFAEAYGQSAADEISVHLKECEQCHPSPRIGSCHAERVFKLSLLHVPTHSFEPPQAAPSSGPAGFVNGLFSNLRFRF